MGPRTLLPANQLSRSTVEPGLVRTLPVGRLLNPCVRSRYTILLQATLDLFKD